MVSIASASRFEDIGAGRGAERLEASPRSSKIWRPDRVARMALEPALPAGPPGPFVVGRAPLPGIGINVVFLLLVRCDLMVAAGMARRAHDAGVMAAVRQHEGHVGVGQQVDLVDRAPGRDVVGKRAHREDRHAYIAKGNRTAVDLVTPRRKIVVEE